VSAGLVVNTEKIKYKTTKETVNVANKDIELNGQNFKRVDTFKYLG
jgi:hypothetical protein